MSIVTPTACDVDEQRMRLTTVTWRERVFSMHTANRQDSSNALFRSMHRCASDATRVGWLTSDDAVDVHANCRGRSGVAAWLLTTVQQSLRKRTERVDAIVHALLSPPTRARYRRWLCDLYRFVAPVETRLASVPTVVHALPERFKSGLLACDLLALDLTPVEHSRLAQRYRGPSISSTAAALGWLFAVERVALPVVGIRARLEPELMTELETAGSFVAAYSCDSMQRWLELARLIEASVWDEEDITELTRAAETALGELEAILAWDRCTAETPVTAVVEDARE